MARSRKVAAKQASAELVAFGQLPPYAAATPERAQAAVLAACKDALAAAERLAASAAKPSWANLMAPLAARQERIDREYSLVAHLSAVCASDAWDRANRTCLAAVAATSTQLGQNAALYERVARLKRARPQVAARRRRILAEAVAEFELAGVGLPPAKRRRFAANAQRLAELGTTFDENVRKATERWSLTVTDEAALGEMPANLRATFATKARGKKAWRFSLLDPSYLAFMTHATDRRRRRQMALARNARASDLGPARLSNLPILGETLRLRFSQARLLGYADPATMILSRRMARRPATVARFLGKLAQRARPAARRELAALAAFAKKELGISKLEPWDLAFVTERYRKATTGLADAQVRPYFPASKVVAGLLGCLKKLFGVSCVPLPGAPAWHPQVRCLEVRRGGRRIGKLYLDLYARERKQGGAWAHNAQARVRAGARRQEPVALINCNFAPPAGAAAAAEAYLSFQEIVVLFHEAGHAFHYLLAEVDDYLASGLHGVEWDAVELPSQFLEGFCFRREVCTGMSAHQTTGAKLPAALHARLEGSRTFLSGLHVTRQLSFASYDLALHTQARAEPLALWRRVRDTHMLTPQLANDRFPCAFGHIFAGGYAAGYYGYLWAEVLAADAYEMFAAPKADLGQLGARYVRAILRPGGTRDALDNFRALRGRRPDPAALLRRLGLAAGRA